ncbi:hypothetical protein, partial [Baekduia sp.]|uniref:hypothetical protein n=1 Tax=Baekduia sp. TaxID=2600305 RepID=UPI002DFAD3EA|nr:hypothetical protein [Baekduia sp.]
SCATTAVLSSAGLPGVTVSSVTSSGYAVTATSKSSNTFTITKDPTTGRVTRSCTGCTGSTW